MKPHHFTSSNAQYKIDPIKVSKDETFWKLTWESNLGPIQLSSIGTPVLAGHLIPFYERAINGMKFHARAMGGGKLHEIE